MILERFQEAMKLLYTVNVKECFGCPPGTLKICLIEEGPRENELVISLVYSAFGFDLHWIDLPSGELRTTPLYKREMFPPEEPGNVQYIKPADWPAEADEPITIPAKDN